MNRRSVEWLASPAEDDDAPADGYEMTFKVTEDWFAVDADQLLLPIEVTSKSTIAMPDESYPALLKQYGGEQLLNDMLLSDQELEPGSEWLLMRNEQLLTIDPAP